MIIYTYLYDDARGHAQGHPKYLLPHVKQPKTWPLVNWEVMEAFSEALR